MLYLVQVEALVGWVELEVESLQPVTPGLSTVGTCGLLWGPGWSSPTALTSGSALITCSGWVVESLTSIE